MATLVGAVFADGVCLAADRRVTDGETVRSERFRRLIPFERAAVGIAGPPSPAQAIERAVRTEVRDQTITDVDPFRAARFERVVERAIRGHPATALTAAPGDDRARLARIDPEAGTTHDRVAAVGSGAALALGQLEALELERSVAAGAEELRRILDTVAERDQETNDRVDVVTVAEDGTVTTAASDG